MMLREMLECEPVVWKYEHEKFRPRKAEARKILREVASLVKPIMRRRGWKVGTLAEFWPPEEFLLGRNYGQGQRIYLRLRPFNDERQFYPIEVIADVMLHELSHIVHDSHDEHFHALWNQLRLEYCQLVPWYQNHNNKQLVWKAFLCKGCLSTGHNRRCGDGSKNPTEARIAAEKMLRDVLVG